MLILDNAPRQPPAEELVKNTEDKKIGTMYMPSNVTANESNHIRLLKLEKMLFLENFKFDNEDEIPLSRLFQENEVQCIRRGDKLLSTIFPNVHTYIIGHYNPAVRIIDLVSHTIVVAVN